MTKRGRIGKKSEIGEDESSKRASGVLIVLPGSKVVDPPHDYALIKSGTGRHVP